MLIEQLSKLYATPEGYYGVAELKTTFLKAGNVPSGTSTCGTIAHVPWLWHRKRSGLDDNHTSLGQSRGLWTAL